MISERVLSGVNNKDWSIKQLSLMSIDYIVSIIVFYDAF